jgi:hypothetical protein
VLYIVVISIDDKLFKLMFDDNFHICMIYGIEIKSINQSIKIVKLCFENKVVNLLKLFFIF